MELARDRRQEQGVAAGSKARLRGVACLLATAVWSVGVVAGMGYLERYDQRAGPETVVLPQEELGGELSPVRTDTDVHWQLKLFLHPHCPCSRASVAAWERLLEQLSGEAIEAEVVWVRPPEAAVGWEAGSLQERVQQMKGVRQWTDVGGVVASHYGVKTSGCLVIINKEGRVVYRGGLTVGRGRTNTFAVAESVARAIRQCGDFPASPVYGCPLLTPPP